MSTGPDTSGPLSVAEIQAALRVLRRPALGGPDPGSWCLGNDWLGPVVLPSDTAVRWGRGWVAVVAAHPGAGASCVALLLADALSATHRAASLVELAIPSRSGLTAATETELGLDASGEWRQGRRGTALLYRRATDQPAAAWPRPVEREGTTLVDIGMPAPAVVARLGRDRPPVVVVFRATVPGVWAADRLIDDLDYPDPQQLVLAGVGNTRWPGVVNAAAGPALRRLQGEGRVVAVPSDRLLHLTGPTPKPPPRPLLAAGLSVLDRILPAPSGRDDTAATGLRTHRKDSS